MDEAMDVLRILWRAGEDEKISYNGKYYQFKDALFSPPPVQPGGPALWVAGSSKAALRRAAQRGDAWHPSTLSLDRFIKLAREFQAIPTDRSPIISARLRLSFNGDDPQAQLRGSPKAIIDGLRQYQLAGLSYPVITFPGDSQQQREEAMQRFREQVVESFVDPV